MGPGVPIHSDESLHPTSDALWATMPWRILPIIFGAGLPFPGCFLDREDTASLQSWRRLDEWPTDWECHGNCSERDGDWGKGLMAILQIGLVGCGARGRKHAEVLCEFEDVELAAVCDVIRVTRDSLADEFDVSSRYSDVGLMLETESLDAVFVATPAHLNAPTALRCLSLGIDTLLEKPPGLTLEETIDLRDAAARAGARGMVGWNRRFHPMIVNAREMVEAQGPVTQLVGEFHKSITRYIELGCYPEELLDNLFLETPIHALDIVRVIAGAEVREVHSVVRRSISNYKDVYAALILFETGCVAQLSANYTTDARLERYEIHGRQISVYLEGISQGTAVHQGERRELFVPSSNGTKEQARYFLDCIKADSPISLPAANLDEAVRTMQLAQRILSGLKS